MSPLIDAKSVGELLGQKARTVCEYTVTLPGFPRPYRLPTPSGGFGRPRCKKEDIEKWVEKFKS